MRTPRASRTSADPHRDDAALLPCLATTTPAHSGIPLERPARYRPLDFTFLANIVEDPNCIYVRTDSPIRTLDDLVRAAKAGDSTSSSP